MDQTAIEAIGDLRTQAENIVITETLGRAVALPNDWQLHDLEKYRERPSRFRGTMTTSSIEDYIEYVLKGKPGAQTFANRTVNRIERNSVAPAMTAVTIFNIGTQAEPGHADFRAELFIPPTPDFARFVSAPLTKFNQRELIDLFEDLGGSAMFTTGSAEYQQTLAASTGVAAIREVKVTRKSEREHTHADFKQARSALDSVEASSKLGMPSGLLFEGKLYEGLGVQRLWARLSMVASDDEPTFRLRIPHLEGALIEAESSLAKTLRDRLTGIQVTVGSFTR